MTTRDELLALVTALWFEIDHGNGSGASAYFTAGASLTFEQATFTGTDAINEVYSNRTLRGPRVSRHLVTNFHLVDETKDSATAVSALLLFAQDGEIPRPATDPLLVADVMDTYERVDGSWLVASRRIKNLFIGPASELAVPTE